MNKNVVTYETISFYRKELKEKIEAALGRFEMDLEYDGMKLKKISIDFEFENEDNKFTKNFGSD